MIDNDMYVFTKLPGPGESGESFGLRVKLPPSHLSIAHGGEFTLSFMLNVKQRSSEYQFLCTLCLFDLTPIGNHNPILTVSAEDALSTRSLIGIKPIPSNYPSN